MSISELGSLGEFVSSIAVLVTLLFLGFQVRQSNLLARRNELNVGHSQISRLRVAMAENADLAEIMVQGLPSATLGEADQVRFDCVVSEMFWSSFHIWDRTRLGLYDEQEWGRHVGSLVPFLLSPGVLNWWANNKDQFPAGFQKAIDEGVANP